MFDISTVQLDWQGLNLKLETGLMARQADGAVLATLGSTSVLCTVCAAKSFNPSNDFFPLSVHYIEKAYSAGKVPGGFFKREGRPSEIEILNSRLIEFNVCSPSDSYQKFISLNLISEFSIFISFASEELLIIFFWSIIGIILDAADKPWFRTILSVDNDLTGW